ncbi:hypothetical protein ElyMa_003907500 [Elysia marginata]|uniref:Endonuclease/exonuclease/phosphatase domain-containing protein n=1 Tax=Elysia marginata TaxID=1093978 RepID=A0AAV4FP72_9GAST|nr:hypothetical protein ElyMa_003907500 [Elysia marginata]
MEPLAPDGTETKLGNDHKPILVWLQSSRISQTLQTHTIPLQTRSDRYTKTLNTGCSPSHQTSVPDSSETWRTNQRIKSKLMGFEGRCLERILGIRWENRVTNKEISERTTIRPIVEEGKKRIWRWLGESTRSKKERKNTGYLEEMSGK